MSLTFVVTIITICFYLLGFACAVAALWRSRTPQGSTAWLVSLMSLPFVSIPLFLIFGRNKFFGYIKKRQFIDSQSKELIEEIRNTIRFDVTTPSKLDLLKPLLHKTDQQSFTDDNDVELLIDGEATYNSMLDAIEKAQHYILFQFYIFRNDKTGDKFIDLLCKKSKENVKVYFIYDRIGCKVSKKNIRKLTSCGVEIHSFKSRKYFVNKFQINFRNHRKIIVIDGKVCFLGGLNIGNEYLGLGKLGFWRDTHLKITGPVALSAQLTFVRDWYWITETIPANLNWTEQKSKHGKAKTIIISTGPADDTNLCLLMHLALFNSAKKRIWISNPYFLPTEGLMNALNIAELRGVDVRIIVPKRNDNRTVQLASEAYQDYLVNKGARIYAYEKGFTHQKAILIDDEFVVIGTSNLDSRSLFINFEITAIVENDNELTKKVEAMFLKDFSNSKELTSKDFKNQRFIHKTLVRAANLLAPIL